MKSTFLVASAVKNAGQTKVILKDVNGGDGLNEFRAGSQRGDVVLDFYGDQPKPEPGKTFVLTLEEYVETAETNEDSGATTDTATEKATASPLSIAFNALVTIAVDENGKPTLNIEAATEDAAPVETEETTDTQDTANLPDNGINAQPAAVDSTASDAPEGAAEDSGSVSAGDTGINADNTDTNTQVKAGPAAGANNSEAGGTNVANADNLADKTIDPLGGGAQVS